MRVTVSMDGRWHGAYLLPSFETARAEEARASSGRGPSLYAALMLGA